MNTNIPIICSGNNNVGSVIQLDSRGQLMMSNAMPKSRALFIRTNEGDFVVPSRDDMHHYYRVMLLGILFKLDVPKVEGYYVGL